MNLARLNLIAISVIGANWLLPNLVDATGPSPLHVGSDLQLFLDDWLIDSTDGVELTLHSPRSAEVVLQKDKPWEDSTMYDPVVLKVGDRYRLWYRTNFNGPPFYTGYAESSDGIHFTKPSLGIIEFNGSKENNLVWVGNHHIENGPPCVLSVFKDANPAVSDNERYKATGIVKGAGNQYGLKALVSPDGLHWQQLQNDYVVPPKGAFDTHNITYWDAVRSHYVAYVRGFDKDGIRRIRMAATTDFRSFPVPEFVTIHNPPDFKIEDLYKNAATPYYRRPDIVLMFPKRYHPTRKRFSEWKHDGLSDIVFMFSRDGTTFDRRFREAFLRPGPDPLNWHERAIEVGPGLVPTGECEMSLYYFEHYRTESVRLRRGVLRVDGIASVHAGARTGEFTTKPFVFAGGGLRLNMSTSAVGSVQVELQSAGGTPIPGFSKADCPELFGDDIERPVSWNQRNDVSSLAGQPIRMRIVLKDADLYSLQFH